MNSAVLKNPEMSFMDIIYPSLNLGKSAFEAQNDLLFKLWCQSKYFRL